MHNEYPYIIVVILILGCIVISYLHHRQNMKLLCSVSSPYRGTRAERRLVIRMLRRGVHPKAIFHDLYLQKRNGEFSQIDIVVATPQGLLAIEVKDYSGWLFGNEKQRYWTQVLNYGKEKYCFYNPNDYRCATCGSKEGEQHRYWKNTKTILQKGHMDPSKPLEPGNIIPQCEKCNRADRNYWIYDEKGRVVGIANEKVVDKCPKSLKIKIYERLKAELEKR